MIPRYTRPQMAAIWSDENRLKLWLEVEVCALEACERRGLTPRGIAERIRERAKVDPARVEEIERVTRHDVAAFVDHICEQVPEAAGYLHFGMTSSDVLDTAFAMQLRDAASLLDEDLDSLRGAIKKLAFEHKQTVMIGRTHGVHAEPITFGLKCAVWYDEFGRHKKRLELAKEQVSYGKLSGVVGTFGHLPPDIEEEVMGRLGLKPAPASSQVVQRDRHAFFFSVLAGIASSCEKVAVEIRHLQRTEVREVEERFHKGQKGSSAMPHKRNPVLSENVSGLARLIRAYSVAALENVALWHERDISHSSVERIIAPDATIALDFVLHRLRGILENLVVYPERMKQNMELTRGLVFSQPLMLKLVERGLARDEAYRLVQSCAAVSWDEGRDFRDVVRSNEDVAKLIGTDELDELFDYRRFLAWIDRIYDRVFGDG
ncbi:MAG TPA: adenylosuccinate lyase [Proteobacteria bacterium]|nr:adenylosuccinate lyase [Pseudomonadota bacterium]